MMKDIIEFFDDHLRKIVRELSEEGIIISLDNIPEIIEATSFRIRSERMKGRTHEEGGCPCYDTGKHCYDRNGGVKEPNCFLCGCPEFYVDLEKNPVTGCKLGKVYEIGIGGTGGYYLPYPKSPDGLIWSCERCPHPYKQEVVEDYIKKNIEMLTRLQSEVNSE